ncbi:Plasmid associated protein, pRiA4b ORF-3-like [Halapricum desulfuricans]|uniref:Plasmid associated protein, pRiA4b ORF-3-like n=1 Tax=Halapricum desulfuricans TaxID=2841257 RepID=A0A897NKE2_9EURY|nr:hypothetical protein [Halapricum desulfuricans]QSG13217.1 Plasmid associated protein, pRiA4b ORF-3-like [Halapricum desulfuricans]
MSEPTDRFVIEIGTGTVAHIIDTDADQSETDSHFSLGLSGPGEKMCSRGNRHPGDKRVPFAEFASHHDIDKVGFEGDAPDEICSYCWSNTREAVENDRDPDDLSEQIGTVGYRLRWKQKGRAREEWYDIVVRPETTMAELDRLVCRITTLDDFHLRMYGLEDEYLESSLNVLPDHQYEEAGDRTYTRASEMTIADVAERARLREGDRLSLIYDFGTPSHYYCIVKEVYEPDRLDEVLDGDVITSTDTAAIVREKRP